MNEVYEVIASKEGEFWEIEVPALDRATFTTRRGEIERSAQDMIALVLDVPVEDVKIALDLVFPPQLQVAWEAARSEMLQAQKAEETAAGTVRMVIGKVLDAGWNQRDIAAVTGLSYQRISQMINKAS